MDAATSPHPTDQTLGSFGLGRLDDASAEAVHQHLEQCPDCRRRVASLSSDSFLDRVRGAQPPRGPSTLGQPQPTDPVTPPPANTLPPGLADHPDYEIKKELGRGGMGVVYLAHNTLMGRDEVLKVMGRQIMERPGVVERFVREIRAVAKLRHPNIVTAYSASRLGESIVFAMEHVDGLDLAKMVKAKGQLPVAHACNFIYQAALGLQHAHEKGLVHRDIKPANLMLSREGNRPTVKVCDFGLAKVAREEKVDGGLTSEGQALGTPDFIAPEQILDAPSADIRADIYSLGGTLFYLLTGRPPFQAKSLYDVYQAHISRDADPLNLVRPEVPAELAALVAKMMAKDPARRFQTPDEVARALTPFFKKVGAGATSQSPKADVSRADPVNARRPSPAATPDRPAPKAPEASHHETRWESMIDFQDAETSGEPLPALPPVRRPPSAKRPMVVAGVLGGLIALGVIVIIIRDKSGRETEIKVPPGSTVTIKETNDAAPAPDAGTAEETRAAIGKPPVLVTEEEADRRRSQGVLTRLQKKVPVNFPTDTPLIDFLKYIKDAMGDGGDGGVPIYVDPLGLAEADKTMTSTFIRELPSEAVGDALKGVLGQLGLVYTVTHGMVYITAGPESGLADLTEDLAHVSVARGDDSPATKAVLARLNKTVPMNFPTDTPLDDVLKYVKEAMGEPEASLFVDPNGLMDADKTMASTVLIELEGVPLKCSLHLVLNQIGMTYFVDKGVIKITSWSLGRGIATPTDGADMAEWANGLNNESHWRMVGDAIRGKGGLAAPDPAAPDAAVLHTKRDDFGDVRIKLWSLNTDNKTSYVVIRRPTSENAKSAVSGYAVAVGGPTSGKSGTVTLGSITEVNGHEPGEFPPPVARAPSTPNKPGDWHRVEITVSGNLIRTRVDGKQSAEYRDSDSTYPAGTIALACRAGAKMRVSGVVIEESGVEASGGTGGLPASGTGPGAPGGKPPLPLAAAAPRVKTLCLFNGKDRNGWKDLLANGSQWKVLDGGILEGRGGGNAKPALLQTKRQDFGDFRLRLKVRYPEAGGGQISIRRSSKGEVSSFYAVQHSDLNDRSAGSIAKVIDQSRNIPSDYVAKARPIPTKANVWYDFEISAVGNRIAVTIDGKPVAAYEDPQRSLGSGAIALGVRGVTTVQFRDLTVEEYPEPAGETGPNVTESSAPGRTAVATVDKPARVKGPGEPPAPPAANAKEGGTSKPALAPLGTKLAFPALRGHKRAVYRVAFSPDGRLLASGGDDEDVVLWDLATGDPARRLRRVEVSHGLTFARKEPILYTARQTRWPAPEACGGIMALDVATGAEITFPSLAAHSYQSVAVDARSRYLAGGRADGAVRVYDMTRFEDVQEGKALVRHFFEFNLQVLSGPVISLDFHPTAPVVAAACRDGSLHLLKVANGDVNGLARSGTKFDDVPSALCVKFRPDGLTLASAGKDGMVRFWDDQGKPIRSVRASGGPINWLAYSPDGRLLATAGEDKAVTLWDAETGEKRAEIKDHTQGVLGVEFSRDGRRLATCGRDFQVFVYDLKPG